MTSVALVVHPDRAEAADIAQRAEHWLASQGHEALMVDDEAESLDMDRVDVAVSLGGDGTMLRTVALAIPRGVPVLGVNLGRLGYLTEVEPAGLESALGRFCDGDYAVEERMTLEVSVRRAEGGAPTARPSYVALNEAVVEKTVPGHTVRLSAAIAGRPFVTYAADGLLVATPTGSTAYNLSARGPIVSPRLRAIVVTPISPHMLFDRPLVLEPEEWIRLDVEQPRPGILVVDGQIIASLEPGDGVEVRAGEAPARIVTFGGRDFHAILRARFNLADR
ncbi:MAG TPA: NAD(+)/NADH kinase [Acidimicrobiales bacterium]|nr:NAD(+)/NADH kinase [Acidimicrobiales bacterium]